MNCRPLIILHKFHSCPELLEENLAVSTVPISYDTPHFKRKIAVSFISNVGFLPTQFNEDLLKPPGNVRSFHTLCLFIFMGLWGAYWASLVRWYRSINEKNLLGIWRSHACASHHNPFIFVCWSQTDGIFRSTALHCCCPCPAPI